MTKRQASCIHLGGRQGLAAAQSLSRVATTETESAEAAMRRARFLPRALVLLSCLCSPPALADRCADDADPALLAETEAAIARIAAQQEAGHYRRQDSYWSSVLALNRMIEIEAPASGAEAAVAAARGALARIDSALAQIDAAAFLAASPLPAGRPLVIRIVDEPGPGGTEAWNWCDGGDCTVELFPALWEREPEAVAFTLAHEMFHAVQSLAFPAVNHCNSYWWVEGSAEWFANLAIPNTSYSAEAGYLADFDSLSPSTRLIDMDYEAVAFFFWADERFGPDFPLSLGAFGNAGLNSVEAVGSLLSPADWIDFAQVYLSGWLAYPDGRLAQPAPDLGPLLPATAGTPVPLAGPPLSLPRARLALGPGTWTLTRQGDEGAHAALVQHETLPEWTPLAAAGAGTARYYSCDGEGVLPVAAIGGGGSGTQVALTTEASLAGCDACLVGTWQQRVERAPDAGLVNVFASWGEVARFADGWRFTPGPGVGDAMTMTTTYDHPGPHLELRPDGGFLYNDPRLVVFQGEDDGDWVVHTTYLALDAIAGRWADSAGELRFQGEQRLRAGQFRAETSAENLPLIEQAFDERRALGPSQRLAATAQCSGPLLTLELLLPAGTRRLEYFDRVP